MLRVEFLSTHGGDELVDDKFVTFGANVSSFGAKVKLAEYTPFVFEIILSLERVATILGKK